MESKMQSGYLVLADISGFTSYLSQVELEHANEILGELLETIIDQFKSLLAIAKLEGDAVFAYASAQNIPAGETLLNLIDATYLAFRHRRDIAHRNTTCECNACRAIPTLDLKFFVHRGGYIQQNISGSQEIVGSDVNLAHRLMKNNISQATGWHAYALFTRPTLDELGVQVDDLHEQNESYEHLGEVATTSYNLQDRYQALIEAQRATIPEEEADFSFEYDFPAPPPVVWEWLTDPRRRTEVGHGHVVFTPLLRQGGRNGPGARNHCAHGKGLKSSLVETVLDWRPFEYMTTESVEGKQITRMMYQLEPGPSGRGTRVTTRFQLRMPLPRFLKRIMVSAMMGQNNPMLEMYASAAQRMQPTASAGS